MMQAVSLSTSGRVVLSRRQAGRSSQSRLTSSMPHLATRRGDQLAARVLGGGGEPRKTLKREEEPDEYWSSKGEREGANPMKDPLALIGVLAIFFPFVLLGIAFGFGLVKLP